MNLIEVIKAYEEELRAHGANAAAKLLEDMGVDNCLRPHIAACFKPIDN